MKVVPILENRRMALNGASKVAIWPPSIRAKLACKNKFSVYDPQDFELVLKNLNGKCKIYFSS